MKQFYQDLVTIEPPARPTHDSTEVAGATVKSFLDAAYLLHVRITGPGACESACSSLEAISHKAIAAVSKHWLRWSRARSPNGRRS